MWTWFAQAPPKDGSKHWKRGRSAMELARAWAGSSAPAPPQVMLDALAPLGEIEIWDAIPELVTPLPERGEGRNHDLGVIGRIAEIPTFIGVEAKAGEPFGDMSVAGYWAQAVESKKPSRVPHRIAALLTLLTGIPIDPASDPSWLPPGIRDRGYQLLTAAAGTVLEARRRHCSNAVLVVHEFSPDDPPSNLAKQLHHSRQDLEAFVDWLSDSAGWSTSADSVAQPVALPKSPWLPEGMTLSVAFCWTALD